MMTDIFDGSKGDIRLCEEFILKKRLTTYIQTVNLALADSKTIHPSQSALRRDTPSCHGPEQPLV